MTARVRRLGSLAIALALALFGGSAGCKKVSEDAKVSAAERAANAAIEKYSAASAQANGAHSAVLQSFDVANHAQDISQYKQLLREKVLPAMDAFVARLESMPTETPEIKQIHAQLVDAYKTARVELDAFESELHGTDGLARFGEIRSRLQSGVRTYREALAAYYAANRRQLKLDAPAKPETAPSATAPAGGATPTTASAPATTAPAPDTVAPPAPKATTAP